MAEYREYIKALRQCAKEHEKDKLFTGQINTSDLCNDTAKLLENDVIECSKINKAIEEMNNLEKSYTNMITDEKTLANECYKQYEVIVGTCLEILKRNIGE